MDSCEINHHVDRQSGLYGCSTTFDIGKCQILALQYNTIIYCFISFHMRHSQNTFIKMFIHKYKE